MAELTKDAIDAVLAEHVEDLDETGCPTGTCSCRLSLPAAKDRFDDPLREHLRDEIWALIQDSTKVVANRMTGWEEAPHG